MFAFLRVQNNDLFPIRCFLGNVHKGRPSFCGQFGPPNHPMSDFVPFFVPTQKRMSKFGNTSRHHHHHPKCQYFSWYAGQATMTTFSHFIFFCNKNLKSLLKTLPIILKPVSKNQTQGFVLQKRREGIFEKTVSQIIDWKFVRPFLVYQPPPTLVTFCHLLPHQPSIKSIRHPLWMFPYQSVQTWVIFQAEQGLWSWQDLTCALVKMPQKYTILFQNQS